MNERIRKLREESLKRPYLSSERAELITEFYKTKLDVNDSVPVQRAKAFEYILANKALYVGDNELIVGERGPGPLGTPTYPEICIHSQGDLEIINSRKKICFSVEQQTKDIYEKKITPFWSGKTIREKIFEKVSDEWKSAYEAGVFTEFLEQRAPGHTVPGRKLFTRGLIEIKEDIRDSLERLIGDITPEADAQREELEAMDISAGAMIMFANRYAQKLQKLSDEEDDPVRKKELQIMSGICQRIPAHPPGTFWEALQHYWFFHIGVVTELNPCDSFNPGRLDQHLYLFYKNEIENGLISKSIAKELLQCFWVKFNNHPAPPKVGVTAKESNTYTDFALINVGGVNEDGSDATNELSYLILDVIGEMRILQPSSMVQISKKSPDRLLMRALKIIKTGFGQPSIFNTDAIIQELLNQGKSLEDARNGGCSGCVESGAFGNEAYILTGYFNIPKVIEITLNNGRDPRTTKIVGIKTGDPENFSSFEEFMDAFKQQLEYFIDVKLDGSNIIDRIYSEHMPAPFLSLLIDDCISTAKDYNNGGARYNTMYIQGVGIGSATDSLTAIKYNVYDQKKFSLLKLTDALKADFVGFDSLRNELLNETPKYGNDDDYADDILRRVFRAYFEAIDGKAAANGGVFRANMLSTTCHIYFGSVCGALPDGKKVFQPISEGISPVQGADIKGPTSVIKSASKIDHIKTGGTLLNQKFTPQLLEDEEDLSKLAHLVRAYFKLDGHHIQFNVVKAETLREAQKHPEKYRDLIVRVAGYSDYFIDLTEELQNEIIRRTEHMIYS